MCIPIHPPIDVNNKTRVTVRYINSYCVIRRSLLYLICFPYVPLHCKFDQRLFAGRVACQTLFSLYTGVPVFREEPCCLH
jgi:hypothetical protein